jgi:ubiquitin-protein ligase
VWEDGSDKIFVPDYNLTILVNDIYPFRCPSIEINGEKEDVFIKTFEKENNVNFTMEDRLFDRWVPSLGVYEIVEEHIRLLRRMEELAVHMVV